LQEILGARYVDFEKLANSGRMNDAGSVQQRGAFRASAERPAIRSVAQIAGYNFHAHGSKFRAVLSGQNQAPDLSVTWKTAQGWVGQATRGQQTGQALA
jgi:hypothetical protein